MYEGEITTSKRFGIQLQHRPGKGKLGMWVNKMFFLECQIEIFSTLRNVTARILLH